MQMKNKCFGYDKELHVCLIRGVDCSATQDNYCFHETKEEFDEIFEKEFK